jgi:hypothetical protein
MALKQPGAESRLDRLNVFAFAVGFEEWSTRQCIGT